MLSKIREMRESVTTMASLVSSALMEQRQARILRTICPMPQSRALRILATWRDKGIKPLQATLALAYTGSYRQAVAVGKLSPQEFAKWRAIQEGER